MIMNKNDIDDLRVLLNEIMYARTKKEAEHPIRRMESIASHLKEKIDGYHFGKLEEAISYAKDAAGQVKNKEHCISCSESSWYVFESGMIE